MVIAYLSLVCMHLSLAILLRVYHLTKRPPTLQNAASMAVLVAVRETCMIFTALSHHLSRSLH